MSTKTDSPTIAVPPTAPIFIYTPQSLDALSSSLNTKPPPSPTSSLKACFVRSRPTSTDFSESEYSSLNDFSGLGDGLDSSISSCTSTSTSDELSDFVDRVTLATEQWARAHLAEGDEYDRDGLPPSPNSDARSVALSTLTGVSRHTVVPVRIVRRSDAEVDEGLKIGLKNLEKEKEKVKDGNTNTKRRRTWPSYKAIRRTVSNIVHRKEAPATATATQASTQASTTTPAPVVNQRQRIKSSSASLFSRRRRATTLSDNSDKVSTKPSFLQRALSTSSPSTASRAIAHAPSGFTPLQHRAALRRSRSFSGFTNVLSAIVDAEQEKEVDVDEDLDEATAEARDVVEDIRRRWAFEAVLEEGEENEGFLFERCVEQSLEVL